MILEVSKRGFYLIFESDRLVAGLTQLSERSNRWLACSFKFFSVHSSEAFTMNLADNTSSMLKTCDLCAERNDYLRRAQIMFALCQFA